MQQEKKAGRPWAPALVGLIGGVVAFAAILAIANDMIGAAGVGVIVFALAECAEILYPWQIMKAKMRMCSTCGLKNLSAVKKCVASDTTDFCYLLGHEY